MQFLLIKARSLRFPNFFDLCMLLKPLSDYPAPIFFFIFFFLILSSLLQSSSRLYLASMSSYVVSEKGSRFALDGLGDKSDHWAPYVHPLVRLSANSLSQMSLEMCTESLGSETGSDEIFSFEDSDDYSVWPSSASDDEEYLTEKSTETCYVIKSEVNRKDEKAAAAKPPRRTPASVNYHCSSGRSKPRSFPPPLPSICRRDGRCVSMRRRRMDGRLVVEAVPAPSQNYLHAQRLNGRLLLTFIDSAAEDIYPGGILRAEAAELSSPEQVYEDDSEVVEEEEEVEVVDRGIVVEVKVSRPQMLPQSGGGLKVQLSSVVINKFVGVPLEDEDRWMEEVGRAATATTATAVVAVAAAASSSLSADQGYWKGQLGPQSRPSSPEKLWFTSKGTMNRGDLLHQVRRCSELRRPLFIWEPCCVASS